MEDQRVGAAIRAVRRRRALTQAALASRAGTSASTVVRLEHGRLDRCSLASIRRVAGVLDIRIDVVARWRGGDLDRLLDASHAAMHELLARRWRSLPAWTVAHEVSYSIYGERGVIDALAWHAERRALLVIELKASLTNIGDLMAQADRRTRLAPRIARDRGWEPATVSAWVLIADTRTNRRRVEAHREVLRGRFPLDGHSLRPWLASPDRAVAALTFVPVPGRAPSVTGRGSGAPAR